MLTFEYFQKKNIKKQLDFNSLEQAKKLTYI